MFQFAVRGEKKFWKILIIYYTLNMRTQNTSFYSQYQWSIHLPRNVFISIPHSPYFSISGLKYYPWSIITVPVVHCISGTQYYPRSLLHQSVVHGTTQGPYSLDQWSTVFTLFHIPLSSGTTYNTSSHPLVILQSLSHWSLLRILVPTPCASGPQFSPWSLYLRPRYTKLPLFLWSKNLSCFCINYLGPCV